jgi:hypothetical protein
MRRRTVFSDTFKMFAASFTVWQRFGLLHGSAHHRPRWPFRTRRSHGSLAGRAVNIRSRRWASSAELCQEGGRRAIM